MPWIFHRHHCPYLPGQLHKKMSLPPPLTFMRPASPFAMSISVKK